MKLSQFARLSTWLSLASCLMAAPTSSSYPFTSEYNSNDFQYYGVALGSWLVIEPFINPSLFLAFNATGGSEDDIPVDEYHYTKKLGKEEAHKRLQKHWDTWITEDDFKKVKEYGLNMVRIPIGYWAFELLEDDPYVQGQEYYLDKAIEWAHKYDLKVWVDLHGMPNSQNGFDNSGLRTPVPGWFNETEYVQVSENVITYLFEKYGGANISSQYPNTVLGVEVVNEPFVPGGLPVSNLTDFMDFAYETGREVQAINNTIIYHDAFMDVGYWNDWKNTTGDESDPKQQNYNILFDHHHYAVFDVPSLNRTIDEQVEALKDYCDPIAEEQHVHPSVVGEWTAALTDCTPWLNGVGVGARYDGTHPTNKVPLGDCSNINNWAAWTDEQKINTRKFLEIQLDQYINRMKGFVFWTWKTETAIEWGFTSLVKHGLMPQPFSDRKYYNSNKNSSDDSSSAGLSASANVGVSVSA